MNIIVACDKNWGIGKDGNLLCNLSGDLKYFKEMTMGKTVVMGRVTLESLPGGKGLPGRRNIVMTSRRDYKAVDAEVVHDFAELDEALKDTDTDDVFVIGGAKLYEEMLHMCRNIYVTKIDEEFDADRYFRNLDERDCYDVVKRSEVMEEDGIKYQFVQYMREHNEGGRR